MCRKLTIPRCRGLILTLGDPTNILVLLMEIFAILCQSSVIITGIIFYEWYG